MSPSYIHHDPTVKIIVTRCWNKKLPNIDQKLPKRILSSFYFKVGFSKGAQNVTKYLGYFSTDLWHQELSKIVQSGHTGPLKSMHWVGFILMSAVPHRDWQSKIWYIPSHTPAPSCATPPTPSPMCTMSVVNASRDQNMKHVQCDQMLQ